MNDTNDAAAPGRLERLLPLVEADPENLVLLADAAETALAEGQPAAACDLLDRYALITPLPAREANLAGLAALRSGRFETAAERFAGMVEAGEREPAILFNLAWSRAMLKDFEGALALLADHVATSLPQAAMLHVQILHELGRFDEAGDRARLYVGLFADYEPLMAAVSVLALDLDDEALAAACAARAPDHPDSLTTMGTLTLGEDRPEEALALFETALARNPNVPRAWVGRGLAKLLAGGADSAAEDIDRGAEMFGDHLGSWIAAGWAWFVRKDNAASRARFEKALSIDDAFAEAHGSLAVLDLLDGNVESARRRSEIALRLDRQCYSAALARTLIEAGSGDPEKAQRIYERAINTPVGESGRTIAQAMARLGTRLG